VASDARSEPRPNVAALPGALAAALVFGASAAVLVLEILAVRLLAPYVGLTLETYTTIIGVVLGGIAAGSYVGGLAADRDDPRALLASLLMAGGVLALLTVPLVRLLGDGLDGAGETGALLVALVAILPPAAVLSAVTPVTAKLQLDDLRRTGSIVGRLSAWATAGALFGTFLTGFVLVPLLPVRVTVIAVGGLLVAAGAVAAVRLRAPPRALLVVIAAAAVLGGGGTALGSPCDAESAYFCARIEADPGRPSGRTLWLDDVRHSYVDLEDPRHLEFAYAQRIADVIGDGDALDAVFIGGGGFTLPRWLAATRPGSRSVVLELDPELVDLVRDRLALKTTDALRVRTGDARLTLRDERTGSADLVVGDAFGGRAVPWHLTTKEFMEDVRRVLRPDGLYVMNLIDRDELRLVRAEVRTLLEVFDDVAIHRAGVGNHVLVAADRSFPGDARGFAGDADVLTDDHAPADQLLAPRD
jgi:MFS family permease